MRLFIFGALLLTASCVRANAIGYPYRSALLAYSPARGEFPIAQGYVRAYDGSGSEHLIGYAYPKPSKSSLSYEEVKNENSQQELDSSNLAVSREEQFRAWCEQRYRALKSEIDKLRGEGKQPSYDLTAQIKPLEKILSASTSTETSPEVRNAREEHLRIWNEARLKVLQQESEHLKLQSSYTQPIKIDIKPTEELKTDKAVEDTTEQQKAREEHLRRYQAQLQLIQQLETQRLELLRRINEPQLVKQSTEISNESPIKEESLKTINTDLKAPIPVLETAEVLRAREEYLKLFNEANKLEMQSILAKPNLKSTEPAEIELQPVKDTEEVIRAREQHLKLFQEAKLKAQTDYKQLDNAGPSTPDAYISAALLKTLPGIRQPNQPEQTILTYIPEPAQIEDTPEVKRAREEHLRLVEEAKLKAGEIQTDKNNKIITYIGNKDDTEKIISETELKTSQQEEQRLLEIERLRLRSEEQMREEERLRESERLLAEQRFMEAELLRLQREEQHRMEMERLAEKKLLQQSENLNERNEEKQQIINEINSEIQTTLPQATAYILQREEPQEQPNQYVVRLSAAKVPNSYYIEQTDLSLNPNPAFPRVVYYPSASTTNINPANPFLIRYQQSVQPQMIKEYLDKSAEKLPENIYKTAELKPISADKIPITAAYISPSATMKIDYGQGAGLTELEKATREHFRAHELALEQLRLANLKNTYTKDC